MHDNQNGDTKNDYTVTVAAQNDEVVAKLANGEIDIAALATNVAANLYQKTSGAVQLLTVNGLGILYILERETNDVNAVSDLAGKTIYAFGQGANPEYALNHLLRQNGLEPGTDVTIEWKTSEEINALMISGQADLCMLPVPAATALQIKAKSEDITIRSALSLSDEWDKISDSPLVMSCTVVRTEWAKQNPDAVKAFLADYEGSIDFVKTTVDEAADMVAAFGITPNAVIAKKAIPDCNLTFVSGADTKAATEGYYQVLFDASAASIGGKLPDDGFYYVP